MVKKLKKVVHELHSAQQVLSRAKVKKKKTDPDAELKYLRSELYDLRHSIKLRVDGGFIEPPKPHLSVTDPALVDLGQRIKSVMLSRKYDWFDDQNVVSIEGMDPNGKPNKNRPNAFDDIKMVLNGGGKIILGPFEGTTQPGAFWTTHPMNDGGAFIIALGQQAVWTPGEYHGHTVWRQAEGSHIMGHRDERKTYKRLGKPILEGNIGIHHHGGYDFPRSNISKAAAGCQIIRLVAEQAQFMKLTLQCPRYLKNKKTRLSATVLEARDVP